MSPSHTGGDFSRLVLRDRRHDRKAELRILIERVDAVVLEIHRYAVCEKLSRVLNAVERVTGESRDLFGDDHIKLAVERIVDHLVELLALLRRHARDALVDVAAREFPVRHIADVLGEELFLVLK